VKAHASIPLLRTEPIPSKGKLAGELVLAPPSLKTQPRARGARTALVSGATRVRGSRRFLAFDRGFPLGEEADWPATLETVSETGARRVIALGAHAGALARFLRETRGLEAHA